ncbi:helical backbone metal receptor [soil metagenome]
MQFTDQLNREIILEHFPNRIISLVPSQTELLADLGLEKEVIAITKFCIHPESWFHSKERIGGTKMLDIEKIKSLKPDLIIANKEENEQAQIEELMKTENVWISDIKNLDDALEMIRGIGEITGKKEKADFISSKIKIHFESFYAQMKDVSEKSVAYFIWKNPWMVAGKETFIDQMLTSCKLKNIFADRNERYPEVTINELGEKKPDVILLSSEPYPFSEKHSHLLKDVCTDSKIILVDGEMFSWYGSRLLKSPEYFFSLRTSID